MTVSLEQIDAAAAGLSADDRLHFLDVPDHLSAWTRDLGGLAGKRVMDFGCGTGITAAGVALRKGADLVVGVDINRQWEGCAPVLSRTFGLDGLPSNLIFETVKPGSIPSFDRFDLIYSWSVFEHVGNRLFDGILADLRARLVPGGHFFVQIGPLYFSAEGGHLWALGWRNWEHLTNQISDIEDDIDHRSGLPEASRRSLRSMFRTLNRITADGLIARIEKAGFALVRQYRTEGGIEPPAELLSTYSRDVLVTKQIVALFRATDDPI